MLLYVCGRQNVGSSDQGNKISPKSSSNVKLFCNLNKTDK